MAIKRQTIVDAIVTRLQLILVASGYYTNAGSNVFKWLVSGVDQSQLPALIVRDVQDDIDSQEFLGAADQWTRSLMVEIEALAGPSSTTDTTVRQLVVDVYKALGGATTLSGNAIDIVGVGDSMVVTQDGRQIAGAKITVRVIYRTTRFAES